MQTKTIGIVVGVIIVVGAVVFIMTRPSVAPENTNVNTTANTNQAVTNTTVNQEPERSFSTNTNPATNSNPTTNTSTNTAVEPSRLTVAITSSGTNPKSPSVNSGTIITFVNQDNVTHQISSNPHPSHTDLPGFDLTIGAGSSRSFTFVRTGTWGYHDHLAPFSTQYQGTITVQ